MSGSRFAATSLPQYTELARGPLLAPWVECYWSIRALDAGGRRLERAFARAVGVSPKVLDRVLRLRRAIRALERGTPGWSAIACEAGYADQAHLIREFRSLAGITPARWAAERRAVGFVQYGEDGAGQIRGQDQAATPSEDES